LNTENFGKCHRRVGSSAYGRRQRGLGGRGLPWIFIYGTNTVDRVLKVLFFGVFLLFFRSFFRCSLSPPPPPGKGLLNIAIFGLFCYSVAPPLPGNFSADALVLL